MNFSESDIEKMWIYSLGVTLQRTMPHYRSQHQSKIGGGNGDGLMTSLDYVIALMCEVNLKKRASLMYLLDVSIFIFFILIFFSFPFHSSVLILFV